MSDLLNRAESAEMFTKEELEALLQEAVASGEPVEMTASEWQRLRDDVENDAALRRKAS